jgi:hypothetical protein
VTKSQGVQLYASPSFASSNPIMLAVNYPGATITITGSNFVSESQSCTASACDLPAVLCTIISETVITATVSSAVLPGPCLIRVTWSNSRTQNNYRFRIIEKVAFGGRNTTHQRSNTPLKFLREFGSDNGHCAERVHIPGSDLRNGGQP